MDWDKLLTGMDFIRTRVHNITLLQACMLIHILKNPGVTQPELGQYFHTTQATVCRTVNKLALAVVRTSSGDYEKVGLDLIVLKKDTSDPRRVACFPNEAGQQLLKDLSLLR